MVSALVVGTNTFGTLAEANTYLGDSARAGSWFFLSTDVQAQCLITAARILDRQRWEGTKTVAGQAMSFPRDNLTDAEEVALPANTTPLGIKYGQFELAYDVSLDTSLETSGGQGSNTKRLQAGSASIEYFRPTGGVNGEGSTRFSPNVMEWIRPYLAGISGVGGSFSSGTETESSFGDLPTYGLTQGFP